MKAYTLAPKNIEPCAPVTGGMRWHTLHHDIEEYARLHPRSYVVREPDAAAADGDVAPEQADLAPRILSMPSTEARAGQVYTYQARAFCGNVDGFTWYFEEAIPGMSVDRHTGLVTWTPSAGGYVDVALCARSLYGAVARQGWTVLVHKALPAVRRAVNARFRKALRRKGERVARRAHCVWRRPGAVTRAVVTRPAPSAARRIPAVFHPAAPPGASAAVAFPLRI